MRSSRRRRWCCATSLAWVVCALLCVLPGSSVAAEPEPEPQPPSAELKPLSTAAKLPSAAAKPNLILISVDTLRADRLGAYGYAKPTSPNMDRLASRGVRFANALAPSSWTLPSHMTLFTGLRPREHGLTKSKRTLPAKIPTLTQVLKRNGYRARAWTDGGFVEGRYGFKRGFEWYGEQEAGLTERVVEVEKWITSLPPEQPYFAFIHTYETHCPYEPAPELMKDFRSVEVPEGFETVGKCGNPHFNAEPLTPAHVQVLSDLYDGLVRQADDALSGLFRFLDERDEWKKTIVVLLSDHGEEFYEHGRIGHERSLHQELLRVPLLIAGPGVAPAVVEQPVGLIDVAPTVIDLLGLEGPKMEGRSLVSTFTDVEAAGTPPPVVGSLDRKAHLRSVVDGRYHYIVDRKRKTRRLYDWQNDPNETVDLVARKPEVATRLEAIAAKAETRNSRLVAKKIVVPKEHIERLEALGYIESSSQALQ